MNFAHLPNISYFDRKLPTTKSSITPKSNNGVIISHARFHEIIKIQLYKHMKTYQTILSAAIIAMFFTSCSESKTSDSTESEVAAETKEAADTAESRPSPLMVKEGQIAGKAFKVQYGSPSVKGRELWGDLVPYNVVWRTGANEASYVDLAEEMTVEGKKLAAGKYSLFTIPKETGAWTVIFNSDWDLEHGHFQYDEKNDVLRVDVNPVWNETSKESMSIEIESPGIVIYWEKLELPISIN